MILQILNTLNNVKFFVHYSWVRGTEVRVRNGHAGRQLITGFTDGRYWTGARDVVREGDWRWTDDTHVLMGTPFWGDYGSNQEPTGGVREGCANMPRDDHYFLHDGPCDEVNSAICQYWAS